MIIGRVEKEIIRGKKKPVLRLYFIEESGTEKYIGSLKDWKKDSECSLFVGRGRIWVDEVEQ